MIIGLGDSTTLVTSSDPLPTPIVPDTTTLQYQGGYYGQPLISTAGGYGGVATVDAPTTGYQIGYGIGQWFSNNLLIVGLALGGILLMKGKR